MAKGYFVDSSDKLLDQIDLVSDEWNFCCNKCKSKNIELHVIQLPYKTSLVTEDLPPSARAYYKSLPTLGQAIMQNYTVLGGILVECNDCKHIANDFYNGNKIASPNKNRLREFVTQKYGYDEVMEL